MKNQALLALLLSFLMLSACAEHPGDPQTTGIQQFIGEGFSFKYPDNATLDIRGEDVWATRTLTVRGQDLTLSTDSGDITLPAFEFMVEVFENPGGLDPRTFARQQISGGYQEALDRNEPSGMWPVDPESGEVIGRNVRVRGLEAFEARFFAGDAYIVRTYTGNESRIIALTYRDMPPENNPLHENWKSVRLYALDSVRIR